MVLEVTAGTLRTAGILMLALVTVEAGGLAVLRIVRGQDPRTPFQLAFARAGHAHAGVLLILALLGLLLSDLAGIDGALGVVARTGIWLAALLFPAGFFLSSAGPGRTEPNALIWLLYLGAASLTAGIVATGVGLLQAS